MCVVGGSADDTKKKKGKSRMMIMRQTERRKKKWELYVSSGEKVVGNKGAEGSQEQKKDFPSRSISPALLGKN